VRNVLTKEVTAVAGMELLVSKPMRHHNLLWKIIELHIVIVAPENPFLDG